MVVETSNQTQQSSEVEKQESALVTAHEDEQPKERYGVPRGALAFVLVMLFGYALYWFITWFEVFVLRGA